MDVKILIQSTPNPNALKFVLNVPVKNEGKVTYKSVDQCEDNPLAAALFSIANVVEVYFFDNYITVTQDGNADRDDIEEQIKRTILDMIEGHNPDFKIEGEAVEKPRSTDPEMQKVEEILDRTIRPALQMDGGDVQVIALDDNILTINYQGACGSCPSSTMGTLKAIEGILRDEYNPDLVVELAQY
jgi:Fe-S cluster biogenesis protein NfuA